MVYMDDILIHTPRDSVLHWRVVMDVLQILQLHDLFLKPQKCQFEVDTIEYLGVIITANTIAMDPVKVEGVRNWAKPMTL